MKLFTLIGMILVAQTASAGILAEKYNELVSRTDRSEIQRAVNDVVFYSQQPVAGGYKIRASALNSLNQKFKELEQEQKDSYLQSVMSYFNDDLSQANTLVNELIALHNANSPQIKAKSLELTKLYQKLN